KYLSLFLISCHYETEQWVHNTYVKLTQAVSDMLPRSNLEFPIWGIPSMNWTLTFVHPRNGTCRFGKDDHEHLGERFELLPRENVNIYTRCLNDKTPCVGTGPLSYLALEPNCSMAEYIGTFTKIRDYGVGVTICADKKDTNSGSHGLNSLTQICKLQKGFYWLCGDGHARKSLPLNWKGYCIGGYLIPSMTVHDVVPRGYLRNHIWRIRRKINNPLIERHTAFHSFVRWFIPWLGVNELEKAIVNISAIIEKLENKTLDAIKAQQEEISSLSQVVLQNRMALDLLLAAQGGVCTVINTSCCMYVDQSGRISTDLEEIWKQTRVLHEISKDDLSWSFSEIWNKLTAWLPNFQWLEQVFIALITLVVLGIFVCMLFRCLLCCVTALRRRKVEGGDR
uniref:ERVV2 protein n=1 Tax=Anas platyrhynchos TaxID=8839 RepID=A0A8B9T1U2_ANAPL